METIVDIADKYGVSRSVVDKLFEIYAQEVMSELNFSFVSSMNKPVLIVPLIALDKLERHYSSESELPSVHPYSVN